MTVMPALAPTRTTPLLVHLLGAALAAALLAYVLLWLTQAPAPMVPAPAGPVPSRDADPVLAARLFGDANGAAAALPDNVQVSGVFVAGRDSSAVLATDGRPARVVLLGRELAAGLRLVEVRPDGVVLESRGLRTRYAVPALPVAQPSTVGASFRREADTLTAPGQEGPVRAPAPVGAAGAAPGAAPAGSVAAQASSAVPALPINPANGTLAPGGGARHPLTEIPVAHPGQLPPAGAAPPGN